MKINLWNPSGVLSLSTFLLPPQLFQRRITVIYDPKKILISIFIIHPPWSESIHILHRINNISFAFFSRHSSFPPPTASNSRNLFIKTQMNWLILNQPRARVSTAEEENIINIFYDTPRRKKIWEWNELRVKNWKWEKNLDAFPYRRVYLFGFAPCRSSVNGKHRATMGKQRHYIMMACNPELSRGYNVS